MASRSTHAWISPATAPPRARPPSSTSPAAPRAHGQGYGAREVSEPVQEAAQGGEIGVAGEEVVGAGLEREKRLQRQTACLPGLHPPRVGRAARRAGAVADWQANDAGGLPLGQAVPSSASEHVCVRHDATTSTGLAPQPTHSPRAAPTQDLVVGVVVGRRSPLRGEQVVERGRGPLPTGAAGSSSAAPAGGADTLTLTPRSRRPSTKTTQLSCRPSVEAALAVVFCYASGGRQVREEHCKARGGDGHEHIEFVLLVVVLVSLGDQCGRGRGQGRGTAEEDGQGDTEPPAAPVDPLEDDVVSKVMDADDNGVVAAMDGATAGGHE
ncbi:unnamed protein product [Miscanthus lutarioriparius]|uniref:Uncharacterized protein n=1 Tax=Miscanthus lutarioriparius TaxID=422564 RepID=A0A811Q7F8_9POAL|nr:unnamed protein product [Miscanthus lutarioriparius]